MTDESRCVIVTGAAAGIGQASALRLLSDGFAVAAVDRDADGLGRLESESVRYADRFRAIAFDLCRPYEALVAVVERIREWRGVYGLLNCAGVSSVGDARMTTYEAWNEVIESNLTVPFRLCRILLPEMMAARSGVIINVSSVAGLVGLEKRAAYCAAKTAVLGLTRAIAVDYGRGGIRANAICPGAVETPRIDAMIADEDDRTAARARLAAQQLDGRMGSATEVAALVGRLFSDDFRFVNGAAIAIDGGLTAR